MIRQSVARWVHHLPPLPYAMTALEPFISAETLHYHYEKHHAAYVRKLNELIHGKPDLESQSLESLIKKQDGILFNQAAQVWNHSFYWCCMKKGAGGEPSGKLKDQLIQDFGSIKDFKEKFSNLAAGHFGSGWVWLVFKDNHLHLLPGHDADNPIRGERGIPIMTCDVWEHAYYVDYRNDRPQYLQNWWKLVNWQFANDNLIRLKT
uniref:Superoxide dismutase n=1 Tax=Cardiosporidium cionae TaxID=476202 RepID=A0A3S8V2W0_9APIC|nr:superoxide dismutase [Cardiosporidium cionae]